MKLIEPCFKYKDEYDNYLREVYKVKETNKLGEALQKSNETFDEMILRGKKLSCGENLVGMMKPTTVFWIMEKDKIVGSMNLRHELSEFTYYTIGHLGYYIRPSERNKGYATKALNLAKKFYKKLGLKKILVICDKKNIASEMVILKNGGKLELEMLSFNQQMILRRYWIDLNNSD